MPRGFFDMSTLLQSKQPQSRIPKCGACGLYKVCKSPKMEPSGKGRKRILIVGEAPGKDEDEQGKQFVGKTGKRLENELRKIGIDMRVDCRITNALICRPPGNKIEDDNRIDYCRPNLIQTVEEFKPTVVILLGAKPVESMMPYLWRENDIGGISKWAGWRIPSQKINAWVCPTYHPSHVEREENPVVDRLFARHLAEACAKEGRPFDVVPNYESDVEVIMKPREAAVAIREMIKDGRDCAFDYETNALKPDGDDFVVVSCSISNDDRTIAFPWHKQAIEAMYEFVKSPLGKVASNLKFEERVTKKVFRRGVRNWKLCTMNAAHILDGRPDITSIKFQSFVLLGQDSYDDHIKPLLKSKKGQRLNQIIEEVDLRKLLLYNGLDSLLEIKVGKIQGELLNVRIR